MSVRTVQVGECAQVINGFAFKSQLFTTERRGLPIVRIRDVIRGRSETYYTGDYPSSAVLQNGDLLIGMDGEFNIARWRGGLALLNQRVCKIEALNGKSDISYLRYALPVVLKRIEDRTPFVTVKHLSSEELREETIPLPELSEQKRIARLLDQTDRLRRTYRYALELSDPFPISVFLEMFGEPARNTKGWDRVEFATLGALDRGRSKHRPRNAPHLYGGRYPFIQTGDIASCDKYIKEHHQTYSEAGLKQSKIWPAGTLCITIAANIGRTGILTYPACFPDSVVGFLPRDGVVTEYIQYWLGFLQEHLEKNAPESAQKNINLEILRELTTPLPPLSLQQQFAGVLRKYEQLRSNQREALRQADHLFHSLLHRAFAAKD